MRISTRSMALGAVLTLAATACGASGGDGAGPRTTIAVESTTSSRTGATTTMPDLTPAQAALVEAAAEDLGMRLHLDPTELALVSFKEVTWPDGSLGCPEPGMYYTQALVEGYEVLLRHQDRLYAYHGAQDEVPFLCESEEKDGGHEFVPPPGFND
jgi:hypothetical protein